MFQNGNYPRGVVSIGDLRLVAACTVCGIPLQEGYGISNQYEKTRTYDRGEPGNIYYYFNRDAGISPESVAKVWKDPSEDVAEARMLPERLRLTREVEAWRKLADDIDALHVWVAVANMRAFSQGKMSVGMLSVTDEEKEAAQWISELSARMRKMTTIGNEGKKIAADLVGKWDAAMVAWVKAWAAQYIEIKQAWLKARPSIKIDRGDDRFPLIIPRGKDFQKLLRRWA